MAIITGKKGPAKPDVKRGREIAVVPSKKAGEVALPTDWEKELERYAARSSKVVEVSAGGGSWLTFQGGRLKFKGVEIQGNETDLIVLDEVLENLYYEGTFDPDSPASPVCFAFAREVGELAPHNASPDKQHDACKGCPQNEWGSAATGRGKACKNIVRLAMVPWGDGSLEQVQKAEIAFAKLPVTSVKNWSAYVNGLHAKSNRPPFAFITKLSVVPDTKSQFQVTFEAVEPVPQKLLGSVLQRVKEAEGVIVPAVPYAPIEQSETVPARGGKGKQSSGRKSSKY